MIFRAVHVVGVAVAGVPAGTIGTVLDAVLERITYVNEETGGGGGAAGVQPGERLIG